MPAWRQRRRGQRPRSDETSPTRLRIRWLPASGVLAALRMRAAIPALDDAHEIASLANLAHPRRVDRRARSMTGFPEKEVSPVTQQDESGVVAPRSPARHSWLGLFRHRARSARVTGSGAVR